MRFVVRSLVVLASLGLFLLGTVLASPAAAQSCSSSVSASVSVSAGAGAGTSVSASGSSTCVNGVPQDASANITVTGDSSGVSGQVNAVSSGSGGPTISASDSIGVPGGTIGSPVVISGTQFQATIILRALNLRGTPRIEQNILTQITRNDTFTIVGRNANGAWLQIQLGDTIGWICSAFVRMNIDLSALPVTDNSSATCRR